MVKHNSLDAHMAQLVAKKLKMLEKALDPNLNVAPAYTGHTDPVKEIKDIDREIIKTEEKFSPSGLTEDQQKAVMEALVLMNAQNPDGAREINGVGFNKMDSEFGRSLADQAASRGMLSPKQMFAAMKLLQKYRKTQIPADIANRIWKQ